MRFGNQARSKARAAMGARQAGNPPHHEERANIKKWLLVILMLQFISINIFHSLMCLTSRALSPTELCEEVQRGGILELRKKIITAFITEICEVRIFNNISPKVTFAVVFLKLSVRAQRSKHTGLRTGFLHSGDASSRPISVNIFLFLFISSCSILYSKTLLESTDILILGPL